LRTARAQHIAERAGALLIPNDFFFNNRIEQISAAVYAELEPAVFRPFADAWREAELRRQRNKWSDVCFWQKADIPTRSTNVRFWG